MSLGLKIASAIYQRLVNKMFADPISKTMKVYVDDMLVKNLKFADYLSHLDEMFYILCIYKMKLNPNKCVFGVALGKFLSYMVNQKGIEANLIRSRLYWI